MSLTKQIETLLYIPASPGTPGYPGQPYVPPYCATEETITVCGYVWYAGDGGSGIPIGSPGYGDTPPGAGFWQWECWEMPGATICYPAQAEIPAVPPTPPTPEILIQNLNIGWNSHSRTIDKLERGDYLQFNLGTGSCGIIGVGHRYLEEELPTQFTHGVVIDVTGIKIYESGIVKTELDSVQVVDSVIRIYRSLENKKKIVYYVDKADGTSIAVESSVNLFSDMEKLFVWTWLYTGGDVVPEYDYLTGEVQFSAAAPAGAGSVSAYAGQTVYFQGTGQILFWGANFTGTGTLSIPGLPGHADFTGTGELYAYTHRAEGSLSYLPALTSIGGIDNPGFGSGAVDLPALTCDAYGGTFVPATPVRGFAYIQPLVSAGHMVCTHIMTGDADLPALVSLGADFRYGVSSNDQNLGALGSLGHSGYGNWVFMMEPVWTQDMTSAVADIIIVFTSTGTIDSVFTVSRELAQDIVDDMTATGTFSLLATFAIDIIADALGLSRDMVAIDGVPSLDNYGQVWCVNMDTGASSQYEQYGFNSFFERDGYYYGVAEDGIYQLDGDDDAGNDIASLIDFGENNLGVLGKKGVQNVHVGTSDGTNMYLRVETAAGTFTYQLETCQKGTTGWRAKIPFNVQGTDWRFTLIATGAFELNGVEFVPIKLSRRL